MRPQGPLSGTARRLLRTHVQKAEVAQRGTPPQLHSPPSGLPAEGWGGVQRMHAEERRGCEIDRSWCVLGFRRAVLCCGVVGVVVVVVVVCVGGTGGGAGAWRDVRCGRAQGRRQHVATRCGPKNGC